jgi:RNase P/RNase MRP subunit POP5
MYRQQQAAATAAPDALAAIERRHAELFGNIASARSSLRLVRADDGPGLMIIRCSLQSVDGILVSIALADPEMVTLDMSSSMRRLKRRNKKE